MTQKKRENERGVILVTSFLVLAIIGTFSLTLFLKSTANYNATLRARNRITAFNLAEAGVDQAIAQLKTNPSYTGAGYTALDTAYGASGGYDSQVQTPVVGSTVRRILANGYTPANAVSAYAYENRQVTAYATLGTQSPFNYGIFSNSSIQMSGNAATDSYDSRNGAYNSSQAGSNGDVGTNTTRASFVMLSGNVNIKGDATVGPGGNPSSVITMSGNAAIRGSRTAASASKTLDPVSIPSNLTNLGALNVSGNNTVTLGAGNYWYSSISVSGNGRVNFTGAATVYVSGNVTISGNGFGTSQNKPPNLIINVQGTRNVSITGNGNFYGAVYAPQSNMTVSGNGELFGSLIGNTHQHSGNAKLHYDEALNSAGGGSSGGATMVAWTEGG